MMAQVAPLLQLLIEMPKIYGSAKVFEPCLHDNARKRKASSSYHSE